MIWPTTSKKLSYFHIVHNVQDKNAIYEAENSALNLNFRFSLNKLKGREGIFKTMPSVVIHLGFMGTSK